MRTSWFMRALGVVGLIVVGGVLGLPGLLFVSFLAFCLFVILRNRPLTLSHMAGRAGAEDLGWVRVVVCLAAIAYLLFDDTVGIHLLPPEASSGPRGILGLFYALPIGFESLRESRLCLQAVEAATLAMLVLGAVGMKTRLVLPLATLGTVILAGLHREFTHLNHAGMLPIYLLIVLCFTPCGDGLSLDRWLRTRTDERSWIDRSGASYRYGLSRYACWAVFALTYFFLGMSKFRDGGLHWWRADNLKPIIVSDSLQMAGSWYDFDLGTLLVRLPDPFASGVGLLSCYGESLAILLLFSALARRIVPMLIFAMHLGILMIQELPFPDLLVLPFLFMEVSWVLRILRVPTSSNEGERESGPERLVFLQVLLLGVLATLTVTNLAKVSFFPLTTWHMYSYNRAGDPATWFRLNAHEVDGSVRRTWPGEMLGSLSHGLGFMQMRGIFNSVEGSPQNRRARMYLQRAAQVHNMEVPSEKRISRLELEAWRWDYTVTPDSMDNAVVIRRHAVEISDDRYQDLRQDVQVRRLLDASLEQYRARRYEECIETCRKALDLDPTSVVAFNNICSAYNMLEEWELAIEACRQALALQPDFDRAQGNLQLAEQGASDG